jgi:hypothetical protein
MLLGACYAITIAYSSPYFNYLTIVKINKAPIYQWFWIDMPSLIGREQERLRVPNNVEVTLESNDFCS